jgi:sulfite reductase alpha subunit-like flavoprotein
MRDPSWPRTWIGWPAAYLQAGGSCALTQVVLGKSAKNLHNFFPSPHLITLLYATVSKNTEQLALVVRERLRNAGGEAEVFNVADFPATRLKEVDTLLIFTSSWGAGAPPPDAVEFCHALDYPQLNLEHLEYAVFEHGPRTNGNSCGRRIDAALNARGATRLMPALEGGLRSMAPFEAWFAEVHRELLVVTV